MRRLAVPLLCALAVSLASSCDGGGSSVHAPNGHPDQLSGWHFFTGDGHTQTPADRVFPYETIVTLFADYAVKHRFIYLPAGATMHYDPRAKWDLPIGAVLIKTFAFPIDARHPEMGERLLETRLLVHEPDGRWQPLAYLWNDDQTDAAYFDIGKDMPVSWIDDAGTTHAQTYTMPNVNQCRTCHGETTLLPIGPRTRQLDRDHDFGSGATNQIDHFASLGLFDGTPEPAASREHMVDPFGTAALDVRARSYLDANCGHCHQDGLRASSSGLYLNWEAWSDTDPLAQFHYGRCKLPQARGQGACGLMVDIQPGSPDQSIFICRVGSDDTMIKMPELGRNIVHDEGLQLLRDWIAAMPADDCHMTTTDGGVPDAGTD